MQLQYLYQIENTPSKEDEEEEEDPLDAFMADMSEQAKTLKAEPKVILLHAFDSQN